MAGTRSLPFDARDLARSLVIPIAIHVGLDIPIYFAFACGS